jgi:hypothetical protein
MKALSVLADPGSWFLDSGSCILDFVDVMIKKVLGIQHPVASIQHHPVKCTRLSIPTMPTKKISCNARVNVAVADSTERGVIASPASSGEAISRLEQRDCLPGVNE